MPLTDNQLIILMVTITTIVALIVMTRRPR